MLLGIGDMVKPRVGGVGLKAAIAVLLENQNGSVPPEELATTTKPAA